MTTINLISGSTLGNAEYVAETLSEILISEGFDAPLFYGPSLDELPLQGIWLVICSTYGAGDFPDNIKPLFNELETKAADLSDVSFGAIGLGSTEYDTFCEAIKQAERILKENGAKLLGDRLDIDVTKHEIPEDVAIIWLQDWLKVIK